MSEATWFAANGGALPDEERFRTIADDRIEAAMRAGDDENLGYGPPHGGVHPYDYHPDLECCTRAEREAWLIACRAAEAGEPFERGDHSHAFTEDGRIIIGGMQTDWGLGTFVLRGSQP